MADLTAENTGGAILSLGLMAAIMRGAFRTSTIGTTAARSLIVTCHIL